MLFAFLILTKEIYQKTKNNKYMISFSSNMIPEEIKNISELHNTIDEFFSSLIAKSKKDYVYDIFFLVRCKINKGYKTNTNITIESLGQGNIYSLYELRKKLLGYLKNKKNIIVTIQDKDIEEEDFTVIEFSNLQKDQLKSASINILDLRSIMSFLLETTISFHNILILNKKNRTIDTFSFTHKIMQEEKYLNYLEHLNKFSELQKPLEDFNLRFFIEYFLSTQEIKNQYVRFLTYFSLTESLARLQFSGKNPKINSKKIKTKDLVEALYSDCGIKYILKNGSNIFDVYYDFRNLITHNPGLLLFKAQIKTEKPNLYKFIQNNPDDYLKKLTRTLRMNLKRILSLLIRIELKINDSFELFK